MRFKNQNEKLSLINCEGNILIIREHINNGKRGVISNTYFLQGICNKGKQLICTPLNLLGLKQYFDSIITLKELFLMGKNQKYFLKPSCTQEFEAFDYQDDAIFDTLECGKLYYNQVPKGMRCINLFEGNNNSKPIIMSKKETIQDNCPMYKKHHNCIDGINMLRLPDNWEEIPFLDDLDAEDDEGQLSAMLQDAKIYKLEELDGFLLPTDLHKIKETIFVIQKDDHYFLCETQGADFIKFSTNISKLEVPTFNRFR